MQYIESYVKTGDKRLISYIDFTELMKILLDSMTYYEQFKADNELWTYLFRNKFNYNPAYPDNVFYQYQEEHNKRIFVTGKNNNNKIFPSNDSKLFLPVEIPGITSIVKSAVGLNHTIFVDSFNKVYGMGSNNRGQLGFSKAEDVKVPTEIIIPEKIEIIDVVCGYHFTYILGRDRHTNKQIIYNMGDNRYSQLARKGSSFYSKPTKLVLDFEVKNILCGENHTLFITSSDVYGCGSNVYGQLGKLSISKVGNVIVEPEKIVTYDQILKCTTGANHVVYQNYYGQIIGMGDNRYGQLGLADIKNTKDSGSMNIFYGENKIENCDIFCGANFTILKANQLLLVMGSNNNKQLLQSDDLSNITSPLIVELEIDIKDIHCGYEHVIYENYDGDFYGAGRNIYGELGIGDQITDMYLNPLSIKTDKLVDLVMGDMCTIFLTKGYILVHYNEFLLKEYNKNITFTNIVIDEKSKAKIIFFNDNILPNMNFMTFVYDE